MIIDSRLRVPYGSFKTMFYANVERTKKLAYDRFKMPTSKSLEDASMDTMFQEMQEAGITHGIVPSRAYKALADIDDNDIIKLCNEYPDKLYGAACIEIWDGTENALAMLDKYVINGPCKTIMMEPGFSRTPLYADDEKFFPVYEKCEKENIPLMLAFGGFIGPDYSYCEPILIDRVAQAFPKLKLFLTHGGWPCVTEMCHVASNHTNVWVAPDLYLMHSPGWRDYVDGANYMIPDKICYGSAYPIVDMKAAVQIYQQAGFYADVYEKVMYKNTAAFLGLDLCKE